MLVQTRHRPAKRQARARLSQKTGVVQEQPVKSRRLAVVAAPAVTFRGWLLESLLVSSKEGVQMGVPPEDGW